MGPDISKSEAVLASFVKWVRSSTEGQGRTFASILDADAVAAAIGAADFTELAMVMTCAEREGLIEVGLEGILLGPRAFHSEGA